MAESEVDQQVWVKVKDGKRDRRIHMPYTVLNTPNAYRITARPSARIYAPWQDRNLNKIASTVRESLTTCLSEVTRIPVSDSKVYCPGEADPTGQV
jgi:hypothetical protein